MRSSSAVDAVAQLIGPNIKFNNAKVNLKHPGTATEVKFHQDFLFEPHTNDSLITVLFFIDTVTEQNGPLEVVSGSHRGPLHSHWHDGVFTGAVSSSIQSQAEETSICCTGAAGSAVLMHTRLVHGSRENRSPAPRTLYIVTYSAEDAHPLQNNHIPSGYEGELVRGRSTKRIRCSAYDMAFPEFPDSASFFEQQAKCKRPGMPGPFSKTNADQRDERYSAILTISSSLNPATIPAICAVRHYLARRSSYPLTAEPGNPCFGLRA